MKRQYRVLLGALAPLVQGCYTLTPARGVEPQVGTRVAFDINDAGRQALSGTMGPEIAQVEGRLLEKENGNYRLSVLSVRLLRGGEQVWSGEEVRINSSHLGPAYERKLSPARSLGLAAAGAGGIGAFILTRSLLGSGTDDPNGPPCTGEDCTPTERLGRLSRLGRP